MSITNQPSAPFGRIALSLSGGGFRAASYSLGTMSYLYRVRPGAGTENLLDRVSFVSSTSGGTFAASLFALYARQGKAFPLVYRDLIAAMQGLDLLETALTCLNDDRLWEPDGKQRNYINAFAMAYDQKLFKGAVFGVFDDHPDISKCAVCFNSTEFYKGMSFRFQSGTAESHAVRLGNDYVYFDKAGNPAYRKLKLADIMAASSCFPAGFEPIDFPVDFTYRKENGDGLSAQELENAIFIAEYSGFKRYLQPGEAIGLMDGGITDNQGLYSTMLADKRIAPHAFDLIIVADVTSYFMDPYIPVPVLQEPAARKKSISYYLGRIAKTFRWIGVAWLASLVLAVAGIVTAALAKTQPLLDVAYLVTGLFLPATILLSVTWAMAKSNSLARLFLGALPSQQIRSLLSRFKLDRNFSPEVIQKMADYLSQTKLGSLEQMLKARAASVLTLSMDVNLKETRRLIYEMFFSNHCWDNRRVFNVVYELSSFNTANREHRINQRLHWTPSQEQKDSLLNGLGLLAGVAEEARCMGTTLWFDSRDSKADLLKKIVACGQFTTCVNLLEYIYSLLSLRGAGELIIAQEELDKLLVLEKQVAADWENFKKDPYFLYDQYKQHWCDPGNTAAGA